MSLPHTLPDRLDTVDDYYKYFENLAYRNKKLKHEESAIRFYNSPDGIVGTGIKYPLMCAYMMPGDMRNRRDASVEMFAFKIWILEAFGKNGDRKKIPEIVGRCKVIADEILNRMEEDSRPTGGNDEPFTVFDIGDVQFEPLDDPFLPDGCVGWEVTVPMGNYKNFDYDETKWR